MSRPRYHSRLKGVLSVARDASLAPVALLLSCYHLLVRPQWHLKRYDRGQAKWKCPKCNPETYRRSP